MLLADLHNTSLTESRPSKPKLGFSIDELVGNRGRTPIPAIIEVPPPNPFFPMRTESEIRNPHYISLGRTEACMDTEPNVYQRRFTLPALRDNGVNPFGIPLSRYSFLRNREPVAESHMRAPFPMISGDSQCMYPWFLNSEFGILPHKLPGADPSSFLFHPFRKPKRIRTSFSPSQLLQLEHAFEQNHYVVGNERRELAQVLGLSETQVKVWFQNRRTKYKRQKQDDADSGEGNSKDSFELEEQYSSSDDDEMSSAEIPSPPLHPEIRHSASQSNYSPPITDKTNLWNPLCSTNLTVPSMGQYSKSERCQLLAAASM